MTNEFIDCPACGRSRVSPKADSCPSCGWMLRKCPICRKLFVRSDQIVHKGFNTYYFYFHYECIKPLFVPPEPLLTCGKCGAKNDWWPSAFDLSAKSFGPKNPGFVPCSQCGDPEIGNIIEGRT